MYACMDVCVDVGRDVPYVGMYICSNGNCDLLSLLPLLLHLSPFIITLILACPIPIHHPLTFKLPPITTQIIGQTIIQKRALRKIQKSTLQRRIVQLLHCNNII